jgi:hypothetical protein
LTTHETEFQRPADKVWVAEQRGATTSFTSETARDAVVTSSRMRISTYQHPLHLSPDRPLVILEGVHDTTFVAKTAEAMGLKPLWTMICLNDLEETKQGGDDLSPYLKANASVLKSRPLHAPIIVVRDWEDKSGAAKYAAPLSQHATSRCVCERSGKPVIGDHRKPTWSRRFDRRSVRLAGSPFGGVGGGDLEAVVFA